MLILGTNKDHLFHEHLPKNFLLVDDGKIIDALDPTSLRKAVHFDFSKHTFNPLRGMDYRRAQDFLDVLDAVFPQGQNTLRKMDSNFYLLKQLVTDKPTNLRNLITISDDPAIKDASQKIESLLLSPVLNRVLTTATDDFPLDGTILARLDPSVLGRRDCFVLANLLISVYKGHVIVPKYREYSCPFHLSLIEERRMTVGLNFLDEVSTEIRRSLLMQETLACRCLYDDAEVLAMFAGKPRGTNGFNDYVSACMRGV